jgi:alpha-L-rhamnosidase
MRRYFEFTAGCIEDGLVVREIEGGWCLGDWFMLKSAILPPSYVNTCWLIHALRLYRELATAYGRPYDGELSRLEADCLAAVSGQYESLRDIGAAKVYAAWLGLEEVSAVAAHYDALGHFDTGVLATDILGELLFANGYGEVAYRLLSSEEVGSFLHMKRLGATTLFERWEGGGSDSHPMFGGIARQLFSGILGIRQAAGSVAWQAVTLCPHLPAAMQSAEGSLLTPYGRLSVSLKREGAEVGATVYVPPGIRAASFGKTPIPCDGMAHTFRL